MFVDSWIWRTGMRIFRLRGVNATSWTLFTILFLMVVIHLFEDNYAEKTNQKDKIPEDCVQGNGAYKCPYPSSPDPEQHQKFLNGLDGKRIVFIGDSVTRYSETARFHTSQVCSWLMTDMFLVVAPIRGVFLLLFQNMAKIQLIAAFFYGNSTEKFLRWCKWGICPREQKCSRNTGEARCATYTFANCW